MKEVYFVAGTLHKTHTEGDNAGKIESMLLSGVWACESEVDAENAFEEAVEEYYKGFEVFEIQTHVLGIGWMREMCPHHFVKPSGLVGLDGKPL